MSAEPLGRMDSTSAAVMKADTEPSGHQAESADDTTANVFESSPVALAGATRSVSDRDEEAIEGVTSADAFTRGQIAVVRRRPSTPERIRQRTARLYDEVHELIERQQTRSDRQKDIARRSSSLKRGSLAAAAAAEAAGSRRPRGSSSAAPLASREYGGQGGASHPPAPRLPNLQKTFEESRRRHLEAAQEAKMVFPPALRQVGYDEKDPGAFSLRFQMGSSSSAGGGGGVSQGEVSW